MHVFGALRLGGTEKGMSSSRVKGRCSVPSLDIIDETDRCLVKAVDVGLEKGGQCKMRRPLPFLVVCIHWDSR